MSKFLDKETKRVMLNGAYVLILLWLFYEAIYQLAIDRPEYVPLILLVVVVFVSGIEIAVSTRK